MLSKRGSRDHCQLHHLFIGHSANQLHAMLQPLSYDHLSVVYYMIVAQLFMATANCKSLLNLATQVVSLEMVTPIGEVMVVHKGDDLFDAVVVSLGLLGVVTQITFQAKNAFNLKEVSMVTTLQ